MFTNFASEDFVVDITNCIQKFAAKSCTIKIETSLLALDGVRALAAWMLSVKTNFKVIFTVKDFVVGYREFCNISTDEASIENYSIIKVSKCDFLTFEYVSVVQHRKFESQKHI